MNAMWFLALAVVGVVGASPLTRIDMTPKGVIEPLNITDRDSLQKFIDIIPKGVIEPVNITDRDSLQKFIEENSNDEDFMLEDNELLAFGEGQEIAGKGDEGFNYDDETVREAVQKYIERTSNDEDFMLEENERFAVTGDEKFADEDEEAFDNDDDEDDDTFVEVEDQEFNNDDNAVTWMDGLTVEPL